MAVIALGIVMFKAGRGKASRPATSVSFAHKKELFRKVLGDFCLFLIELCYVP